MNVFRLAIALFLVTLPSTVWAAGAPGQADAEQSASVLHVYGPGGPLRRILVVNGAGQKGLWEDVVGRRGDIASVTKFRANIATVALNSGDARTDWVEDKSLDAWLIWNIWQVSNPSLAEIVPVDEAHQIYRDCGIGLTTQGRSRSEAREFIRFLQSPEGTRIFKKWGWSEHP